MSFRHSFLSNPMYTLSLNSAEQRALGTRKNNRTRRKKRTSEHTPTKEKPEGKTMHEIPGVLGGAPAREHGHGRDDRGSDSMDEPGQNQGDRQASHTRKTMEGTRQRDTTQRIPHRNMGNDPDKEGSENDDGDKQETARVETHTREKARTITATTRTSTLSATTVAVVVAAQCGNTGNNNI